MTAGAVHYFSARDVFEIEEVADMGAGAPAKVVAAEAKAADGVARRARDRDAVIARHEAVSAEAHVARLFQITDHRGIIADVHAVGSDHVYRRAVGHHIDIGPGAAARHFLTAKVVLVPIARIEGIAIDRLDEVPVFLTGLHIRRDKVGRAPPVAQIGLEYNRREGRNGRKRGRERGTRSGLLRRTSRRRLAAKLGRRARRRDSRLTSRDDECGHKSSRAWQKCWRRESGRRGRLARRELQFCAGDDHDFGLARPHGGESERRGRRI